jgi:hypothetical protein
MANTNFSWKCQPQAEGIILEHLKVLEQNPFLMELKKNLENVCSTELIAWVDHVGMPHSPETKKRLEMAGFQKLYDENDAQVYRHMGADLPDIVLSGDPRLSVALIVESIAEFLSVRGIRRSIDGSTLSGYRSSIVEEDDRFIIKVVERRGVQTLDPISEPPEILENIFLAKEFWMTRQRSDFAEAEADVKKIVLLIGQDPAACLILACERHYWQARNRVGQIQKNLQDSLGMGWANHDHHTFRSSRKHFPRLVQLFEDLGFHCRERFFAGEEAGWGAQVMENPRAKLVLFLDVDLLPGEINIDFAHQDLPATEHLGTIGLWCALHGDSILRAGMHHLEAQFNFEGLRNKLLGFGVNFMKPFSDFPYLKQAFSEGEMWPVSKEKVQELLVNKKISAEQAEKFITQGVIGSHMENLQRKEGYKGFNQKNVSVIIKETDPRR